VIGKVAGLFHKDLELIALALPAWKSEGWSMRARHIVLLLTSFAISPAFAGRVESTSSGYRFVEDFRYQGNHAAHIANGAATTVWWDEASWDARGDTSYTAVEPFNSAINNRFHIDIHKAMTANPRDARVNNVSASVGGDGSSGVGIMHLDFQDIISARLRNPMLISNAQVASVSFYAPLFVTTGHWWEIAITPAAGIVGGEHTGVPGQGGAALAGPIVGGAQPGPGHAPAADSINVVAFGASDVPCDTGWQTRFGVTKTIAGTTTQTINYVSQLSELLPTNVDQANTLVHWKLEYSPSGISLLVDLNETGSFSIVESWNVAIPWNEAHVQLMAVAYQADHHPQGACYLGHIREMAWRDVVVQPVKFVATDVFPRNLGAAQVPNQTGFRAYDVRDIQRFGTDVNGVPQPNLGGYSNANSGRYCNDAGYPCFGNQSSASLQLPIPARAGMQVAAAQFVYDTKDRENGSSTSSLSFNGQSIGLLPGHDSVAGAEWVAWVRRAVPLPASTIAASNTINLSLQSGTYLDRLEVEIGYRELNAPLFVNGFEGQSQRSVKATGKAKSKTLNVSELTLTNIIAPFSGKRLAHCGM
jgi:hypothetical protein